MQRIHRYRVSLSLALALGCAGPAGCTGNLKDGPAGGTSGPGSDHRPDPTIGASHTAIGARRLTRLEYGNTIRDLLGVTDAEAKLSEGDSVDFLTNNAHVQKVGLADLEALGRAAEEVSTKALATLKWPVGCSADVANDACLKTFLDGFLLRAFRRPPTTVELARYQKVYATILASATPAEALRSVIESALMAPSFLYRREIGVAGTLTSYELATRLSYLLWSTMPDDALFTAAAKGGLATSDGLRNEITRMLKDPRGAQGIVRFTSEWLGFNKAQLAKKGADILGDLPANLQAELEEETHRFVVDALLGPSHSLKTLLTATYTFADETVARVYHLEGVAGPEFQRVNLDPKQRRGILTQPLVVAAHSKESGYSAVQMGRFVRERLLCQVVNPPPPGVDTTLPPDTGAVLPYRKRLEKHAADTACVSCHEFLDPPGFAYLPFDPIGRYQPLDPTGAAFDTTGTLTRVDRSSASFTDVTSMLDAVAASDDAHACFTRRYVEHAFGRTIATEDIGIYHALTDGLVASDGDFLSFVTALVVSPEFGRSGPTH